MQRHSWRTGERGERRRLLLSSMGCPRYQKWSSRILHGRNYTTGSTTAPRSYSILLSCLFISILILVVVQEECSVWHMANVSLELSFWPLTLPSQLPVWLYRSMPEPLRSALWRLLYQRVQWQWVSRYSGDYHSIRARVCDTSSQVSWYVRMSD